MIIFLQIWGGLCYLFAKILLAKAEGGNANSRFRTLGWIIYLIGVPAWVIVLSLDHNWIAATVEAGGAVTMLLGIVYIWKKWEEIPKILDRGIRTFVFILILTGITYSLYDLRGITSISQILELGVMAGYLIGTYLLAKQNRKGWLWFMLMNTSMGVLMGMQGRWIFSLLQVVSLYFVTLGFIRSKKSKRKISDIINIG